MHKDYETIYQRLKRVGQGAQPTPSVAVMARDGARAIEELSAKLEAAEAATESKPAAPKRTRKKAEPKVEQPVTEEPPSGDGKADGKGGDGDNA